MVDMKNYYNIRKEIHKLYSNNKISNDLHYQLVSIKDKYRCIDSMNIDLESYGIDIDFSETTHKNKKNEVISRVADTLKQFIINNYSYTDEDLDSMLNSPSKTFCDIIVVGNSVQFKL